MSANLQELPLFPLNSVVFPGGALPLRLFEPRYLDMVKDCMRNEHGFGIVLIKNGQESGSAAEVYKHRNRMSYRGLGNITGWLARYYCLW